MKTTRFRILVAVIALCLLLTSCTQPPVETQPPETQATTAPTTEPTEEPTTTPTTQPTTEPTTEPSIEPPTEATMPAFTTELWLTDPEYLSYEEFLQQVPPAHTGGSTDSWMKLVNGIGIKFSLSKSEQLTVQSSIHANTYRVPNARALMNYQAFQTDGKHVYMRSLPHKDAVSSEIIKVELRTGSVTDQLQIDNMVTMWVADATVLYYLTHSEGNYHVYRIYLPEMKQDHLCSMEAPAVLCMQYDQAFHKSSFGPLAWTVINPELLAVVEAELKNPDSKYKVIEDFDFSDIWNAEDPLAALYSIYQQRQLWSYEKLEWLYYFIQQDSGIHGLLDYSYDPLGDTLTTRTGIICQCDFGTRLPHDHYDPVEHEIPEPVLPDASWQPLPDMEAQVQLPADCKPEGSICLEYCAIDVQPSKYYLCVNGAYKEIALDIQLKEFISYDSEDAIYCVTEEDTIIQLSYDGSVYNTLYKSSGELGTILYRDGVLYVKEDDAVLEIDVANGQCRVLLQQKYLQNIALDGEIGLYISAGKGLSYKDYLYHWETGEIAQ